ncbi:MAG: proton-conducting transporter membrane subunit [Parvularculaceae bacterium]
MISPGLAIPLTLAAPAIGFVLIWLTGRSPNIREGVTLATSAILLILTITVFSAVGEGQRPGYILFEIVDGLPLAFQAEPLGAMFALLASFLWLVNSFYSIGYMRGGNEKHQTRFYMSFAIAIGAAMGVAYSANLFTMFVFYEILTLSTFPLVTHKGDAKARRGGRVYLAMLMGASIGLLLPAIVWLYTLTGNIDFTPGGVMAAHIDTVGPLVPVLLGLFVFGIAKAALMPLHSWLPNAMVAPTPVSAFLHAVAVVKAGVFAVLKVTVYIFGADFLRESGAATPFIWIAGGSILLASAIAMHKDNLKARLAYSTVSQLSYVTLGAMLATSMGVMGGAMQIAMHAFGKMTLFMCAGAIYVAAHKQNVSEMRGLGRVMPFTFGAFFIGAMSIVGLPPMGGSWPKFLLMLGAADAHQLAMVVVLMVSSVLNVIYLLSIPVQAFYMSPATIDSKAQGAGAEAKIEWGRLKEAPFFCVAPPVVTALGALILFFCAGGLYDYLAPLIGGG